MNKLCECNEECRLLSMLGISYFLNYQSGYLSGTVRQHHLHCNVCITSATGWVCRSALYRSNMHVPECIWKVVTVRVKFSASTAVVVQEQ